MAKYYTSGNRRRFGMLLVIEFRDEDGWQELARGTDEGGVWASAQAAFERRYGYSAVDRWGSWGNWRCSGLVRVKEVQG